MKKFILLLLLALPFLAVGQSDLELPYSVKVLNPVPLDAYYYNNAHTPYTDVTQVTTQVVSSVRFIGQTFNIAGAEYWFAAGITDIDLVAKGGGGSGGDFWPLGGNGDLIADVTINGFFGVSIGDTAPLSTFRTQTTGGNGTVLTDFVNHPDPEQVAISIAAYDHGLSIDDERDTPTGIEYNADYSANYTDRSLVDKAYVLSVAGGGGSGWPLAGSASFTNDVNIDGATFAFNLNNTNSVSLNNGFSGLSINDNYGGPGIPIAILSTSNYNIILDESAQRGLLSTSYNSVYLSEGPSNNYSWLRAGDLSTNVQLILDGSDGSGGSYSQNLFIDNRSTPSGLEYGNDYSGNYTSRSLVDKDYVDTAIGGGSFWPLSGNASLTGDVNIDGSQYVTIGGITPLTGYVINANGGSTTANLQVDPFGSAFIVGGTAFVNSLQVTSGYINLGTSDNINNTIIHLTPDGSISIQSDYSSFAGLQYFADYSINYTDRSLVDKAYADKIPLTAAPSTASDTGLPGEIRFDSTYLYICIATNTWVRTTLATF